VAVGGLGGFWTGVVPSLVARGEDGPEQAAGLGVARRIAVEPPFPSSFRQVAKHVR